MSERYSIVFSSNTGNTRFLAEAVRAALPQENCDYFGTPDGSVPASDTVYAGFWTDRGTADETARAFLEKLRGKRVFLFGTAGFGGSEEYFDGVLANTEKALDETNTVVGKFMCQGKMPISVKERYLKMREQPQCPPNVEMLIENFDRALSHPDEHDLAVLREKVKEI